ncbi:NAD(P)/FAD-dependent oxidoreductase [Methylocapsa palsarum]|uniref:Nitrite reductase (NADH) large subunit n=1 Tax=Methylocapsa palsarum TaxID=1612308 RepID=A0A1I4C2R5_9HYPH|nr:FAD-dependent oxidoreductase [Methylocapsa palsarum]SFK75374.1 nitrite reductase (NADH) large subunit [Methylocapsa palsarum]
MSEPLVIVGQGMAAARLADELSARALGRYAIVVIGAEPFRAYNRVLLSSVLAGEIAAADIELKPSQWWEGRGVTNLYGSPVAGVDRNAKTVRLESGLELPYSKLVFATGSHPIRLPRPGMDLQGVMTFRTMGDVDAMLREAALGRRAAVIGGGLLGLEAAYGLAKAGVKVTLIHVVDRLMERQLDASAARLLAEAMRTKGVEVMLEAETDFIVGTDRAEGVALKNGIQIEADLVVCAVGVRPNADLARAAGLAVNRGIVVDDAMATSDADIFALGECAEHRGVAYGLVEPAYEQAKVLARRLTGDSRAAFAGSTLATNLKIAGVALFSAGDFNDAGREAIVFEDPAAGVYKKLVIEAGRLVGAVLFGDAVDGLWYQDLIRSGASIESIRDTLAFGQAASSLSEAA